MPLALHAYHLAVLLYGVQWCGRGVSGVSANIGLCVVPGGKEKSGVAQDEEGRVLQARFSRPSDVLRTWEAQGTAAAELAREDYALRHWVRPPPLPAPFIVCTLPRGILSGPCRPLARGVLCCPADPWLVASSHAPAWPLHTSVINNGCITWKPCKEFEGRC
jgi:hypothetical protein